MISSYGLYLFKNRRGKSIMGKIFISLSAFAITSSLLTTNAFAETTTVSQKLIEMPVQVAQDSSVIKPIGSVFTEKQLKTVKTKTALKQVDSMEALKEDLIQEMRQFNTSAQYTYNGSLTMDQLKEVIDEVIKDDYVHGTLAKYSYGMRTVSSKNTITFNMTFHHTQQQEAELTTAVKNIVKDIISPAMTDIEKVKAVNDYVVTHTVYTSSGTKTSVHSPYTIISEGKGVCQAYALLTYRLLEEAGIENKYVTGYAGESHAWNLVKLNGEWYHLDTTWNDPTFSWANLSQEPYLKNYVRYNYFLISDQTIFKDHTIDPGYPTSAKSDYFPGVATMNSSVLDNSDVVGKKYLFNTPAYIDNSWYGADANKKLVRLSNGIATNLSGDHLAYGVTKVNNRIYFMNERRELWAYDLDDQILLQVIDGKIDHVEIDNDTFIASNNGDVVYREKLEKDDHDDNLDNVEDDSYVDDTEGNVPTIAVDKSALKEVVERAGNIFDFTVLEDEDDYWPYKKAYNEGFKLLKNDEATAEEVETTIQQLKDLIVLYFEQKHTRSALAYQIDEALKMDIPGYDPRWKVIKEKTDLAKEVVRNRYATQTEIDEAIRQVHRAVLNAQSPVDKTQLLTLLDQAIVAGDLSTVVAQADAVFMNEDATEEEVYHAVSLLQQALSSNDLKPEQIISQLPDLQRPFTPDFKDLAQQLLTLFKQYEQLGLTDELSDDTLSKIQQVQQLHDKLTAFENRLANQQAWTEIPKTTTNPYKRWTVSLSTPVAHTVANAKCIKVYDMFGEELNVTVSLNGKQITITPEEAYEADVPYTLFINKALTSQSGKQLKQDLYMQFKFEKN